MNLLHLDAVAPQPWKNGGGTTRELLAWPATDDWWLRISVADVERDGPFSPFPGVKRWFAVLDGAGVELQWPGRIERLDEWSSLLAVEGDDAPECRLIAGPTRDFNIMHRAARGRVAVLPAAAPPPSGFGWLALFTRDALWLEGGNPYPLDVPAMTLGWSAWKPWRVASGSTTRAWWIAFDGDAEAQP